MNSNCDDELSVESVEVVCSIQQACVSYVPFTCSTRSSFSVLRQFLSLSLSPLIRLCAKQRFLSIRKHCDVGFWRSMVG